jgi:hypothetical protein
MFETYSEEKGYMGKNHARGSGKVAIRLSYLSREKERRCVELS